MELVLELYFLMLLLVNDGIFVKLRNVEHPVNYIVTKN